jgi:hypothetical protein
MLGAIALLTAVMQAMAAGELIDPTRPPEGLAAMAGAGTVSAGAATAARGLQMVVISKTRQAAVIDGRTIELGGKYGDARLIEVNENGVVLQAKHGRKTVMLFPRIKITKAEMKTEIAVAASSVQTGKPEDKPVVPEEEK